MSWTYNFTSNPSVAYVRLLIPDTDTLHQIFSDEEINAFYNIQASMWQSSMFWSPPSGNSTLPSQPLSYLRVAALALDTLGNNSARLAGVLQLLDVKLDTSKASQLLHESAANYRSVEDNAGAFVIIEQVNNDWSFLERFWKQVQRQQSGGLLLG